MSTVKLATVEGHEIELDEADHAKLLAWPDLDLSQIHVVEDDAVHALKPSTGKLHALTLEEMLDIPAKECNACHRMLPVVVFQTRGTSGPCRNTCSACRSAARRAKREADAISLEASFSLVVPVTGEPRGMLKNIWDRIQAKTPKVHVVVNGEQLPAPPVEMGHHHARVPLCTPAYDFAGFVKVDTQAFQTITRSPLKGDRVLWFLHPHGSVTLKALDVHGTIRIRRLNHLLREYGLGTTLEIERVAYPG